MYEFRQRRFTRPVFLRSYSQKSIGYCFSCTSYELENPQIIEMKRKGCSVVYEELQATVKSCIERSELNAAMENLNSGDQFFVPSLEYLGNDISEVLLLVRKVIYKGAYLLTLDELINTRELGKAALSIIGFIESFYSLRSQGSFANKSLQFQIKRERVNSASGRPRINKLKELLVIRLRSEGYSYRAIREQTGVSLSTIRRILLESNNI